jgi:hypothetical protein
MRRTYVYFISLLFLIISIPHQVNAQDTLLIPLKIKVGLEVTGPVIYMIEKNNLSVEGFISADLNEKAAVILGGGFLDYKYSQYNYEYLNKGIFMRAGMDFNLLKPEKSKGRYWAGVGLRYGLSRFSSEYPTFRTDSSSYWGTVSSSIAQKTDWAHFLEITPGVRTELFRNFTMGWTISLRMLLYTGTGKDMKPISIPGFGTGTKRVSGGISYFFVWNIPYKKIKVITKKEVPVVQEETKTTVGQQGAGIRQ